MVAGHTVCTIFVCTLQLTPHHTLDQTFCIHQFIPRWIYNLFLFQFKCSPEGLPLKFLSWKKVIFWMPSPTESLLPTTWQKVKGKIVTNFSPSDFPQILLSGQGQGSNCSTQCVLHTHLSKMHLVHALNQCSKVHVSRSSYSTLLKSLIEIIQLNFYIFAFLTCKIQDSPLVFPRW